MKEKTLYFCTYFDSNYLAKGLALYHSLSCHARLFRLWVLCFDGLTYSILQRLSLPEVIPIPLTDFEKDDIELLKAKNNRSRIEYYFTCTPSLPLYIFNNYPEVDLVTYLDADLFFFSDPVVLYQELGKGSVFIIGHRFPLHLRYLEQYGVYNVGWLSFRRNESAFSCLDWWRRRCIEWCQDRCQDSRFADQKYLDNWPSLFPGVVIAQHKGANLAPWNLNNYKIRTEKGSVFVDGQPLVFFHFHTFRQIKSWLYDSGVTDYKVKLPWVVKQNIYTPYIRLLRKLNKQISPFLPKTFVTSNIRYPAKSSVCQNVSFLESAINKLRAMRGSFKNILIRQYLFFWNGFII